MFYGSPIPKTSRDTICRMLEYSHPFKRWEDKTMATRRKNQHVIIEGSDIRDEYHALIAVWILQMLLNSSSAFNQFFGRRGFHCELCEFFYISDENEKELKASDVKRTLRFLLTIYEKQSDWTGTLFKNIKLLAARLQLTEIQQQILSLVILKERYEELQDCFAFLHQPSETYMYANMAKVFAVDSHAIKRAMVGSGSLLRSGLLKFGEGYKSSIGLKPMEGLCDALMSENNDEGQLLRHFLEPANEGTLDITDYPHIRDDIELLRAMLATSLEKKHSGVNILLYGTPGSGKTELARLLASMIDASLFEVKAENDNGDPVSGSQRLEGFRLCQQILTLDNRSLILFDEVEDVFPSRGFSFLGMEMKSGENKGWVNKTLENNATPAIWICNQISQIDPAFIRRFDYALELNTPPKSVRLNIIRSRLENVPVSEPFMQRLAEYEQLSPAQISKASSVLDKLLCDDQEAAEAVLEKVLGNTAKAMGQKPLVRRHQYSSKYSLDYLNANIDLPKLVEGLQHSQHGSICFYGAPGTGKTALAGYIAEQLDKPLLCKRASDILSKWVGEAEKNIASMFEEARQEDAVLVLDEADSFLRDRRLANKSWEITQVNELLVQMEIFDGLFICSTNLMDELDQASLRRFAIKVQFDYLNPNQAVNMLKQECTGSPSSEDCRALAMIPNLAPGDFATVKRRLAILGKELCPQSFVAGLGEESQIKQDGNNRRIGFCL